MMKLKTIINSNRQFLLTAVFGVAVFCFWLFWLPHLMVAREGMQLFLWNTDYLMKRLTMPGGLAQYLGEMIVQFFLNPVYGALWYAVLLVAAQLLTWRLFSNKRSLLSNNLPLLSNNLPLLRNKAWLLSYIVPLVLWALACNPNIPMTPIVAVVLTLALMNLLPKARKARFVTACVMVPVGYWLLGPAIVLMVIAPITSIVYHISLFVLLVFCIVGSAWLTPYPLRQVARGIDYYWEGDKVGTYEEMEYDMEMRRQRWEVMATKVEQPPTLKSVSSAFLMSEISLSMGMVNLSQRTAFEAMEAIPNYNKSARALCRLVETNIITGQYDVARKYIAILEETTFYRGWARKMTALMDHPEQIKDYPLYDRLKEIYDNGKDQFFY